MKFLYDAICSASRYMFGGGEEERVIKAEETPTKRVLSEGEASQVKRAIALLMRNNHDFLQNRTQLREEYLRKNRCLSLALTNKTKRRYTFEEKTQLRENFAEYKKSYEAQQETLKDRKIKIENKIYTKYASVAEFLPDREVDGFIMVAATPAATVKPKL